jgi:hypothetical protein
MKQEALVKFLDKYAIPLPPKPEKKDKKSKSSKKTAQATATPSSQPEELCTLSSLTLS